MLMQNKKIRMLQVVLPKGPRNFPWPVWLGLAAGVATFGYPLLILLLVSVFPNLGGGSLEGFLEPYREMLQTPGLGDMWRNSLACATAATAASWILGLPAGWLMARTNLRGKGMLRISLLVPVMAPPYLLALAYVLLFQPNGLVDTFTFPIPEWMRSTFFSFWGVALVMTLTSFGAVALLVEAALHSISTRVEDAARCLGVPWWKLSLRITLPLLFPALLNAGILVFIDTLSNFGVAAVLGPRSNLPLLPSMIYELVTTWPVDLPLATALASLLAITAMVLLSLSRFFLASRAYHSERPPVGRLMRLGLGRQTLAWAFFIGLFLFSSILPNLAVLLMSVMESWRDGSPSFTLAHYAAILEPGSRGLEALSTSLVLSLSAATICVVVGGVTSYALARFRGPAVSALDHMSLLPRVVPNIVVAVALILAWNAAWVPLPVYGNVTILLIAYVAIYQAIALRFGDAAMQQVSQARKRRSLFGSFPREDHPAGGFSLDPSEPVCGVGDHHHPVPARLGRLHYAAAPGSPDHRGLHLQPV